MKRKSCLILLAAAALAGCDAAFLQQIEVDQPPGTVVSVSSTLDEEVSTAVRTYAAQNDLSCDTASGLPVTCARIPMRVFAFHSPGGATVCYAAGGIPTEMKKNAQRAAALKEELVRKFGSARVLSAPMSGTWSDRCLAGARG